MNSKTSEEKTVKIIFGGHFLSFVFASFKKISSLTASGISYGDRKVS